MSQIYLVATSSSAARAGVDKQQLHNIWACFSVSKHDTRLKYSTLFLLLAGFRVQQQYHD